MYKKIRSTAIQYTFFKQGTCKSEVVENLKIIYLRQFLANSLQPVVNQLTIKSGIWKTLPLTPVGLGQLDKNKKFSQISVCMSQYLGFGFQGLFQKK